MILEGKRALVTGASRGIGRACALELSRRGARVAVHYHQQREAAERVAGEIGDGRGRVPVLQADIGVPEQLEKLFAAVEEAFHGLDILVNNAGEISVKPSVEVTTEEWERMLDVNARSTLLCTQQAVRLMREGGYIVNVSTELTGKTLPGCLAYTVSKTAVEVLTRYLAVELGPKNIVVNAVAPGVTETDMVRSFLEMPDFRQSVVERTPAGRVGTPEDIARVVAFLASSDAYWLRGQTLVANGGGTLK